MLHRQRHSSCAVLPRVTPPPGLVADAKFRTQTRFPAFAYAEAASKLLLDETIVLVLNRKLNCLLELLVCFYQIHGVLKDRDIITSSIHCNSPLVSQSHNAVLLKIIHLILQLRSGFYIVRIDKAAPCLSKCTWLLAAFRGI